MSEFKFKKAERKYLIQLTELVHDFSYDDINIAPESFLEDWDLFDVYVIAEGNKLVAFLAGFNTYKFHKAEKGFEIQSLYVKPMYRKKGLAKMLFEKIISEKYKQGIKRFSLGVEKNNPAAIAFYEGFGLKKCDDNQFRYNFQGDKLEKFVNKGSI